VTLKMNAVTEIFEKISETSGINKIGRLGAGDSISILPAGGRQIRRYLDGSEKSELVIAVMSCGKEQKAIIERISVSAERIVRNARALRGDTWQVLSAKLAAAPSPITAEPDGSYIYQGQIVLIYNKKER